MRDFLLLYVPPPPPRRPCNLYFSHFVSHFPGLLASFACHLFLFHLPRFFFDTLFLARNGRRR